MSVRWRPELTTDQGREMLWRDFLMSGTVGSPPLENGRSAHSDSGTDWCFSLERDLHLSSPWCSWLFSDWSVSYCLSVPVGLVGESDWSPERGPGGSGGTSPGVRSHSVRPCPQHSGRGGVHLPQRLVVLVRAGWHQCFWRSERHEGQPETPESSDGQSRRPCPGTAHTPL